MIELARFRGSDACFIDSEDLFVFYSKQASKLLTTLANSRKQPLRAGVPRENCKRPKSFG